MTTLCGIGEGRKVIKKNTRCDGNTLGSSLKGPGFKPRPRQEKVKNIFSCFWLVALIPMRFTS